MTLIMDAITDRNAGAHRHSIEKIFSRLGKTDTAADVLNSSFSNNQSVLIDEGT